MDKLKYIKLENEDGSYSSSIPLAVDSDHVDVDGSTLTTKLGALATKTEVQAVASGSPAGVYETVATLTTADPDHSKIYLVIADGHWYYYSGSTWTDGGIYQATSLSNEEAQKLNESYANIKNIKEQPSLNGFVAIDGTINTSSDARHTDYIVVNGYDKIKYRSRISSAGYEIAFFDRNKTLISDISIAGTNTNTVKTINTPINAYYAIVSVYGSSYFGASFISCTNTTSIVNDVNKLNIDINPNKQIEKYYIITEKPTLDGHIDNNGEIGEGSQLKHSNITNVKGFKYIEYKTYFSGSSAYELIFYDENLNILTDVSIHADASLNIKRINIPNTAYYCALNCYGNSNIPNSYLKLYNDDVNLYTSLINKNILIFGDSITACVSQNQNSDLETTSYSWPDNPTLRMWPRLFHDYFLPKEIRNYAKSQATYKTSSTYDNPRLSVTNQVIISINDKNNPNNVFNQSTFNPDIVIFAAGTNQITASAGTYDQAMSKTIYESDSHTINYNATINNLDLSIEMEAARYCLMRIKHEWPLAQIYLVTPIQRMSRNNLTNVLNIELPKLAQRYGAIVIDGCDNGITQEGNVYQGEGVTLSDGLHPNQNGQYLMTRQILKSIESNYFDYSVFE